MKTEGAADGAVSRRAFLGTGALGVGAAAMVASGEARSATPAPLADENPWRYDVDKLRRVDPAWLHYERVAQFPVEHPAARRLAVGPDGRLQVAAGKSVIGFTPEGARAGEVAVGDFVRAVQVMGDGRLLVGLRDHVEVFDEKGRRLATWGRFGGKPFVTALALADQEVYVADSGNRVVYRCDADGRVRLKIGARDPEHQVPGLVLPSPFLDVEPGADGLLWVNNPGRHKVERYTRDGELEGSWGVPGVAIESFCGCCNPVALALLPEGRCVTAEKGLPRVKVYTADGKLESVVAGPDSFAAVSSEDREARTTTDTVHDGLDVAVDRGGRVWVLDLVGSTLQAFVRKGGVGAKAA